MNYTRRAAFGSAMDSDKTCVCDRLKVIQTMLSYLARCEFVWKCDWKKGECLREKEEFLVVEEICGGGMTMICGGGVFCAHQINF